MPQRSGVSCLVAVLKAAMSLYAALVACDSDFLEELGLEGWESDLDDMIDDLRGLTSMQDIEEEA